MSELPLPWFGPGQDPGPSFTELVHRTLPDAAPFARPDAGPGTNRLDGPRDLPEIPHGTTVVAIRYDAGVIMAGDRRATAGYMISGRRMEKVQPADDFSGVAISGAAGPAMEMVRLFQTELEHYEKVEGEPLSLEGKANRLSQMLRSNLPAALQGFVVIPLFAGYDRRRERGRLFQYDVTGGRYEELDYHATGSGSIHARNWIKAHWDETLAREAALDLALTSLFQAADEDAATGGPDLVRGIFPTLSVIDAEGYVAQEEEAVAERAQRLLGGGEAS